MNIVEQVLILSAQRNDLSQELNERLHLLLGDFLNDLHLNFKQGIGYYKKQRELNYTVIVKNQDEIETLMKYAFDNFNQDSVFHQDSNGICRILSKNGDTKQVGKLRIANPKEMERLENFTILSNKIYTTEAV
ncbi:MAG: hypothetical protein ACXAAH_11570 [Promethearchaeota archaeon]|jgi:hypothetical protein